MALTRDQQSAIRHSPKKSSARCYHRVAEIHDPIRLRVVVLINTDPQSQPKVPARSSTPSIT
jgi:hypothetical protein